MNIPVALTSGRRVLDLRDIGARPTPSSVLCSFNFETAVIRTPPGHSLNVLLISGIRPRLILLLLNHMAGGLRALYLPFYDRAEVGRFAPCRQLRADSYFRAGEGTRRSTQTFFESMHFT